jgi:cytochrome b
MHKVRVWDLPTRLFHMVLACCFVALVITGNVGGEAMVWHFRLGFAMLALLLFRFLWGFAGGLWSRWSQLRLHPKALVHYWRSPSVLQAGHNPMGSWSVLGLLVLLLLQVMTGLISDDEISNAGPFVPWVSSSLSAAATHWHTETGKMILLLLVALHLAAIWFYRRVKKQALTHAMVWGDQTLADPAPASRDDARTRWLALVVCLACSAVALFLWRIAP